LPFVQSLTAGLQWYPEITHHAPNVPIVLVGTKLDKRNDPETVAKLKQQFGVEGISWDMGNDLKDKIGAAYYNECSALTQVGLKTVFDNAIR
jgi:GTPase SAR1 family protein